MGYKAGMTHIVRDVDKPGSKLHKKETAEVRARLQDPKHPCRLATASSMSPDSCTQALGPRQTSSSPGYIWLLRAAMHAYEETGLALPRAVHVLCEKRIHSVQLH